MINVLEIKNKLGNGCTVPYVVWCDNGKTYVVKFPGNPQGKKTLINEYIASRLCDYLELPILPYTLINIEQQNYKDEMNNEIELIEGTAFGTEYDENALPILNSGMISSASNNYDAIKILIFDLLIGNYDRNRGNLLINSVNKKIIMIDHSHIFGLGTLWDKYQLPRLIEEKFSITDLNEFNFQNIKNSLKIDETFYKELNRFIEKVKNINKDFIENIINDVPIDWELNTMEKDLLCDYILIRFKRLDEILELLNI